MGLKQTWESVDEMGSSYDTFDNDDAFDDSNWPGPNSSMVDEVDYHFTPVVGAAEQIHVVSVIGAVYELMINAINFHDSIRSNYYYFQLGKSMAMFGARLFVAGDFFFQMEILEPMDPWIRYK